MTNATFIIGICIALALGFLIAFLILRYSGVSIIRKAKEEAEIIKKNKNIEAKEKFIALKRRISGNLHRDRKNYSYFSCPSCRTLVRVPKGKGNIRITCPKCGETFVRKS